MFNTDYGGRICSNTSKILEYITVVLTLVPRECLYCLTRNFGKGRVFWAAVLPAEKEILL